MGIKEKILKFLERLGQKTIEVSERPISRIPKTLTLQERLELLKKLQEEVSQEREKKYEKELEEIIEWRKRELEESFTHRFSEFILRHFRGPVASFTRSLKGLDYDLVRANIRMSKEQFVALMLGVSIFAAIFAFLIGILLLMPIDISLMLGLLGFVGGFLYMRNYPRIVWRRRVVEVEKALPYVLRHLASLLSAGVGIAEAMVSVANADYGPISEEFELMIREMHGGTSFEDALTRFEERMASENVSRVVKQILRATKFGGNLADILYKLAEDFSFEYRMKLVEYIQKVNGVAFVYMFITIIMPTLFVVAILAASLMSRALIMPVQGLAVILLFGFPAMSTLVVFMIKRSEPR
ncbi:type II secretion system F family protein [Thermococcus aggregans]|uniref:Type II secretion system F family protein n=1 Tax=Thermococcus aggregans TaxID=110163 RepID=A0A9E7SP49_THEAG|nr:type II secretion system F family protein [Thermococcus aggregans]USS41138.1 type II secretion system F family protein [Thermococcus aggregans]